MIVRDLPTFFAVTGEVMAILSDDSFFAVTGAVMAMLVFFFIGSKNVACNNSKSFI